METLQLWEERNLIEPEKNCSNCNVQEQSDTIIITKNDSTKNLCKDIIKRKWNNKKLTTDEFIEKSNKIHNFKYIYTKTKYGKNQNEKVCIICLRHGEFFQSPNSHLHGSGCPKCGLIRKNNLTKPIKEMSASEYSEYRKTITKRYHEKHKEEINKKIYNKFWRKNCPSCHKIMRYTNQSNLNKSINENLSCKNCKHKLRPYEYLYNYLKYISKRREIYLQLTYEKFLEFTNIKNCKYCDEMVNWTSHTFNKNNKKFGYNLDRIDNNLGYTESNCCVCCTMCNKVKSNTFNYNEMMEIGKAIKNIRRRRNE